MDQFIEKCKISGLRITPQRVAIYEELWGDKTHPSAENIYKRIRKIYPNISLDTVNRTLISFAKIGLLEVVEGKGQAKRYDSDIKHHHHLHCNQCGEIIDFEDATLDQLEIPMEIQTKHKILSKRVVLNGICERCLKGK